MLVPEKYIIPNECELWPDEAWNMKLGLTVQNIRLGKAYKTKKSELIKMGFDFNLQKINYSYPTVKPVLERYKAINGDLIVPQKFVVPECDDWPALMWGIRLGSVVQDIRNKSCYKDRKEELIEIGFDYNPQYRYHTYDAVQSALLQYKAIFGDMNVKSSFIVPQSELWTEDIWGMTLGRYVHLIKKGNKFKDRKNDLLDIGFDFNVKKSYDFSALKAALLSYEGQYGDMFVPSAFKIPNNGMGNGVNTLSSEVWPESTWGMNLGQAVRRVKNGGTHRDKREDLLSIGFKYDSKRDITFDQTLLLSTLDFYHQKKQNKQVEFDFIVPSDELWPEEMRGFTLGAALQSVYKSKTVKMKELRNNLIELGFKVKK